MPDPRLVDTNILIYLTRRTPQTAHLRAAYLPHVEGYVGIISFVTLGELRRSPAQEGWRAERVADLERFLTAFAVRHSDDALCRTWSAMMGELARSGRTLPAADSWIAATALTLGVPLVSHNRRDFEDIPGLALITEAAGPILPTPPSRRTEAQVRLRDLADRLDDDQATRAVAHVEQLLAERRPG